MRLDGGGGLSEETGGRAQGKTKILTFSSVPYLGDLQKLTASLTAEGLAAILKEWYLSYVIVEHIPTGRKWMFTFNAWVEDNVITAPAVPLTLRRRW